MSKCYFHIGRGVTVLIILIIIVALAFIPVFGNSGGNPYDTPQSLSESSKKQSFDKKKRILVLHSYHEGYIWTDRINESIKKTFSEYDNVELFIEYMDTKRYSDSSYFSLLADAYDLKYKYHPIDAVLVSDDHALNFTLQYYERLFSGKQVVFCGINDFKPERVAGREMFTGITEHYDEKGTLDIILKLHPETENIIYITDSTYTGNAFKRRIENVEHAYTERVNIVYYHDIDSDILVDRIRATEGNSVFLWGSYLRTPQGLGLSVSEGVNLVTSNTNLPVYCIWDIVGTGVVGGKITDPHYQGKTAAEMIINTLNGENPDVLDVIYSPVVYKFDYQVLKKHHIDIEDIPEGSVIINKPFSVYQAYKKQINSTIAILLFLVAISILLFVLNRRLVHTEDELTLKNAELHKKTKLLADTNLKLESAMDKAQESDRLKTTFLANLSHEIRTPMNGILGFTSLLKKENVSQQNRARYLDVIDQSGQRMLSLINDLIDISKIEAGQVNINEEPTDIYEMGIYSLNFFEPKAKEKGLQLKYHPDINVKNSVVHTDKKKLEQILFNLLKNAIKFTKSGSIDFGYLFLDNEIEFFVSDTGPGIPEEYQRMIFERFKQVDGSTRREEEGSGLGLAISKAFIEIMGGTIAVISEVGKGSKFFFTIPK